MQDPRELEQHYIMNTYNRSPAKTPCLVRGEGTYLWDNRGKKYLDLLGGLAVNVVGHCHPRVVTAISEQAAQLIHTSNLYYGVPQGELAAVLVENSLPGGKAFFANSGAEANEGAIKLARKHRPGRYKVITAENSFHGRTLATLTATGQAKYHKAFVPLVQGFSYGRFNDLESFSALVDDETAAIMIEPVQGEGGVHVAEPGFIHGLRELCDREELLLIFDEVQCGMGRTGRLWAWEQWGVMPDLLTTAKGLGGGLPIGALVAAKQYSSVLQPGDHATTFGGNPVVCRAALAVFEIILKAGFLEKVREKGELLRKGFEEAIYKWPDLCAGYRGSGLICALQLKKPVAAKILERCTAEGVLINAVGDSILRLLPPLTITGAELEKGLEIIKLALAESNS